MGRTTQYGYDDDNEQTSVTDPEQFVSQTLYNPNGNVTGTIDNNGKQTTYTLDADGRNLPVRGADDAPVRAAHPDHSRAAVVRRRAVVRQDTVARGAVRARRGAGVVLPRRQQQGPVTPIHRR